MLPKKANCCILCWALAIHPPADLTHMVHPIALLTSIALILYTLFIPLLYKG
ncbi:MAG: hypothetical protein ABI426_12280 [Flavobacterium sp.]